MSQPSTVAEALLRYGGMYGSAWRDNTMLAEVVTVTANVDIARVEVPIVGSTRNGHKTGRETREGTMNIQKLDAKWEFEIWSFMSQGLEQRRKDRDDPNTTPQSRTFDLHLQQDDPDALGMEEWVLRDCQLWSLPLGISISDDITEREFTLTWETEEPIYAFKAIRTDDGIRPSWLTATKYASSGVPLPRDI